MILRMYVLLCMALCSYVPPPPLTGCVGRRQPVDPDQASIRGLLMKLSNVEMRCCVCFKELCRFVLVLDVGVFAGLVPKNAGCKIGVFSLPTG